MSNASLMPYAIHAIVLIVLIVLIVHLHGGLGENWFVRKEVDLRG